MYGASGCVAQMLKAWSRADLEKDGREARPGQQMQVGLHSLAAELGIGTLILLPCPLSNEPHEVVSKLLRHHIPTQLKYLRTMQESMKNQQATSKTLRNNLLECHHTTASIVLQSISEAPARRVAMYYSISQCHGIH